MVAKQKDMVAPAMLLKVNRLFLNAVEDAATARTKKYKASNDSLRKELAKAKATLAGVQAEFKPQVERAGAAEKRVAHLEIQVVELKVTVQALQTQNAEMTTAAKA